VELAPDALERFKRYAPVGGADECWPWTGTRNSKGYGQLRVTRGRSPRHVTATRVAWALANGLEFPAGMQACHSCDNPPCVNPNHIWPGTNGENVKDSFAKGRRSAKPRSAKRSDQYGHGKLCIKCGHHRTDDHANGKYWSCSACAAAKGQKRVAQARVGGEVR
jgi:hypothetical protein